MISGGAVSNCTSDREQSVEQILVCVWCTCLCRVALQCTGATCLSLLLHVIDACPMMLQTVFHGVAAARLQPCSATVPVLVLYRWVCHTLAAGHLCNRSIASTEAMQCCTGTEIRAVCQHDTCSCYTDTWPVTAFSKHLRNLQLGYGTVSGGLATSP